MTLPLWLKVFSWKPCGRYKLESIQRVAASLKSGKKVICLINSKPVEIQMIDGEPQVKYLDNVRWKL